MFVYPDIGTGGALQPDLASIVGAIPAGYNMLPTPGGRHGFQTDWTDFTNVGTATFAGWSVTGTEFVSTAAQLTFKTGLSGPDSSANATKLVETTFNGNHAVYAFGNPAITPPLWNEIDAPIPFRVTAIARANERTRVVLSFGDGNIILNPAYAISVGFDLAGMNVGYDNSVGANNTLLGTHISDLGNGWRLCYFDWVVSSGALPSGSPSNNTPQPGLFLDNGTGTAARSISYLGDVTKGLEAFWFNILPVAMWDMTVNTFNEDFNDLSGFDLTNSKAPGFRWYINNRWPNSGPNGGTATVQPDWGPFWNTSNQIPADPSSFSIPSPSVLQVFYNTATNLFTPAQFQSVVTTSNTPGTVPGYTGTVFNAPLLLEWSSVANMEADTFNPGWQGDGNILWVSTIPTLTGVGFAADGGFHFMELDMGSGNPAREGINYNQSTGGFDWSLTFPGFPFPGGINFESSQDLYPTHSVTDADIPYPSTKTGFRKQAQLWINCAYNNYTWGFFLGFRDGQWSGIVVPYSPSGVNPGSAPIGYLSLSDGHKLPIFYSPAISNDPNAPGSVRAFIDWIRVWQPPTIPTVYAFWNAFDMGTAGAAGLAPTLSQNGYQVTKTGADASWQSARAHMCVGYNKDGISFYTGVSTGKWYWEHTLTGNSVGNTSDFMLGFGNTGATVVNSNPGSSAKGAGLQYNTAANTNVNGVTGLTASSITWAANDVIGFAFDADAGHVYVHKNGTYINGNPGSGNGVWTVSSDQWWPMVAMKTAGSTNAVSSNFGQAAFAFTVPPGYNAGVY